MKPTSFVMPILALALVLGCFQAHLAQSREVRLPHSMKGYELYSWKIRGDWHFSLLVGTNRLKTRKEVTSPKVRLKGVEDLKRKLKQLAKGEEVSWPVGRVPRTVLPPEEIIEEVKSYCEERGIIMRVKKRGAGNAPNKALQLTAR